MGVACSNGDGMPDGRGKTGRTLVKGEKQREKSRQKDFLEKKGPGYRSKNVSLSKKVTDLSKKKKKGMVVWGKKADLRSRRSQSEVWAKTARENSYSGGPKHKVSPPIKVQMAQRKKKTTRHS